MKKYYVKSNVNMQAKNNAWRVLQEFANEQNGTLILGDETLDKFVNSVAAKVDEVNKQHPRCQDLSFKKQNQENAHLCLYADLHPDHAFSITFLPIKREL